MAATRDASDDMTVVKLLPRRPPRVEAGLSRAGGPLEPRPAVGEGVVARVGEELCFEGLCDAPDVALAEAVAGRDEDHARVSGAARRYQFGVQGTEVTEVVRDDRSLLLARERHELGIGSRFPLGVLLDRLDVVPARSQGGGDRWREHLVEQQLQRLNAAWPASHAAWAASFSLSLSSIHSSISSR